MNEGLTDSVRAYLQVHRFAVLATINRDGMPQQSTVWYELQGDEIMMNTRRGRLKDRNLRRDSRCSICIEDEYHYVTLTGTVRLIDDQSVAKEDIKRLAILNHGQELGEQMARDEYGTQERVTIRMTIERVHAYEV